MDLIKILWIFLTVLFVSEFFQIFLDRYENLMKLLFPCEGKEVKETNFKKLMVMKITL